MSKDKREENFARTVIFADDDSPDFLCPFDLRRKTHSYGLLEKNLTDRRWRTRVPSPFFPEARAVENHAIHAALCSEILFESRDAHLRGVDTHEYPRSGLQPSTGSQNLHCGGHQGSSVPLKRRPERRRANQQPSSEIALKEAK